MTDEEITEAAEIIANLGRMGKAPLDGEFVLCLRTRDDRVYPYEYVADLCDGSVPALFEHHHNLLAELRGASAVERNQ